MNQDTYDLFEEFVNSDLIDKVIESRIRQSILDLRFSIDAIEHRNRTEGGLPSYIRQDLEDNWRDLDALTVLTSTTLVITSLSVSLSGITRKSSSIRRGGTTGTKVMSSEGFG